MFVVIGAPFECELDSGVAAPAVARRLLTEWFGGALAHHMMATATLLVSELVTNALTHGAGRITLKAQLSKRRLLVAVLDEGGGFERELRERDLQPAEVGGWGLSIVDTESSRWGVHRDRSYVWFELERPESRRGSRIKRADRLTSSPPWRRSAAVSRTVGLGYCGRVPTDRLSEVLAAMAAVDGDRSSVLDRLCAAAVGLLSLQGAGISLMADGQLRGTAGVSGPGVAAVQELQFELGEGPCVDAWAGMVPVLEPDLASPEVARWPVFAPGAVAAGVLAVFVFPLRLGAIRVGVLVFYRDRAGGLDGDELVYGLVLADLATWVILGLQSRAPEEALHELLAEEPPHWAEVHQATGMVAVQLGVGLDEAFVRLRGYAFADGRSLRDIARDVVARRLRLEPSA